MCNHLPFGRAFSIPVLSALLLLLLLALGEPSLAAPALEKTMRNPWMRGDAIREWLFCGPFPNRMEGLSESAPTAPTQGENTDFLTEHGGEIAIRPYGGLSHSLPDGAPTTWTPFTSLSDDIFFWQAYGEWEQYWVVGYAYTTVSRAEPDRAVLALSSLAPISVWLNGVLVTSPDSWNAGREVDELIEIGLQAGENSLLVKCSQRGGDPDDWHFSLAILSLEQGRRRDQARFEPSLLSAVGTGKEPLTVVTDRTRHRLAPVEGVVSVDVVAPGGDEVAQREVPRGERAEFPTDLWPDGPYEVVTVLRLPDGRESMAYLQWYKGDPAAAVRRLVTRAEDADGSTAAEMIVRMLAARALDRTGGDLASLDATGALGLHSTLMELAELNQAGAGGRGGIRSRGMVHLAYRDEVDGSPQFAQCFLPPGYTAEKRWPMLVYLHGRNSKNPPYHRWSSAGMHDSLADTYGAIVVRAHGRGNTGYRGIGYRDVLRCIELARTTFSVDEDRVYLLGFSMGGMGTWHVGSRDPDLFAALGVMSGAHDYHTRMNDEQLAALSTWERFQHEATSSFVQADQLLSTPLFAIHGELDGSVSVEGQRYGVRMLQRWGYDVKYHEVPGAYHIDTAKFHTNELCDWLLQHTRSASPTNVRVRAVDLRTASAHWLEVTQRENPVAVMAANARIVAPNVIRLDTDNVLEVSLSPDASLVDPTQPLRVIWDSTDVREVRLEGQGKATLRARGYEPAGTVKRPELPGGLQDIHNTPYAIVLGTTSEDASMRQACHRLARAMIEDWEDWQHWTPRNFRDDEIGEDELQQYSLLLIGGPADNSVTARLMSQLPLEISSKRIAVDGHPFSAADGAVKMIYPHPLNPDRYVAIIAATSSAGMDLAAGMNFGRGGLENADFTVIQRDPDAPADAEAKATSGFFDHSWRFREAYLSTSSGEK